MVCGTGADADVILLRDGVLLGEDALFALVVELHGAAEVSLYIMCVQLAKWR